MQLAKLSALLSWAIAAGAVGGLVRMGGGGGGIDGEGGCPECAEGQWGRLELGGGAEFSTSRVSSKATKVVAVGSTASGRRRRPAWTSIARTLQSR